VNLVLAIPFALRIVMLFFAGAVAGRLVNEAVARLTHPLGPIAAGERARGPMRGTSVRGRRWPIVGWWRSRRDAEAIVTWLRPLLVEVATGALFAALYWWEVDRLGVLAPVGGMAGAIPGAWLAVAHAQFLSHLLLVGLMLTATLVDLDEMVIPDAITVPGTLAGLALAVLLPTSMLPDVAQVAAGAIAPGAAPLVPAELPPMLTLFGPNLWPAAFDGFPHWQSLLLALACVGAWSVALLPRLWFTRHGWAKAVRYFFAYIARRSAWPIVLAIAAVVGACTAGMWYHGGPRWQALLTSLVGVAVGGSLAWTVRIVGGWVLGREAMGFGDVTLMAMIGSFLGWQACLLVFFLAPFAGLAFGVAQWCLHGETELPYGPYLCLAALVVMVRWASLWHWFSGPFFVPWLVPVALACCLVLLPILLGLVRLVRITLGR